MVSERSFNKMGNTRLTPSLVILSVVVLHWLTSDRQEDHSHSATEPRPTLSAMPTFDSAADGFTVGKYTAGMEISDDDDIEEGSHSARHSARPSHLSRDSWISGEVVQLPKHVLVKACERVFPPKST